MKIRKHIQAGDVLWNGAIVSQSFEITYNRLQDRINAFTMAGLDAPEYLLNASHQQTETVSFALIP